MLRKRLPGPSFVSKEPEVASGCCLPRPQAGRPSPSWPVCVPGTTGTHRERVHACLSSAQFKCQPLKPVLSYKKECVCCPGGSGHRCQD